MAGLTDGASVSKTYFPVSRIQERREEKVRLPLAILAVIPVLTTILLSGTPGRAYAGADPWPTDWLPRFTKASTEGRDIIFNAGTTQIRLHDGRWDRVSSTSLNNLKESKTTAVQQNTACSIPNGILAKYKNRYKDADVLQCEPGGRIWFASGGYCGEGDDDPELNQGYLYSYAPESGEVTKYSEYLPKCLEFVGLVQAKNSLVGATIYQAEYGQGPGVTLLLDLRHLNKLPRIIKNPHPTGPVVGMTDYNSRCDCIWFATSEGIERLVVGKGTWERRYFDYEVAKDNRLRMTLVTKKPGNEKMWLGRMLHNYPIRDLRGFIAAWNKSRPVKYDRARTGPLLLPFYIAAAEYSKDKLDAWKFGQLMGIIAQHQDKANRKKVRAFIEKLLAGPMDLERRWYVVSRAGAFGLEHTKELEDAYFDELLKDYFIRPTASYLDYNNVVRLAFEHPEFLPRLRDYYQTHTITFDVEKEFLDRARSYSSWPQYSIIADAIEQGRKRHEHRLQLLEMCGQIASPLYESAMSDKDKILAVLQARQETDEQAKFLNYGSDSCSRAASMILFNDKLRQRRIALLMEVVSENPELTPFALKALNDIFSMNFRSISEWKNWWSTHENTPLTPFPVPANKIASAPKFPPRHYKRFHMHFDVNSDGTFREKVEIVTKIDSESDVQTPRLIVLDVLGQTVLGYKVGKWTSTVLDAYTLKKNGQHIEAIHSGMPPEIQFQDVSVGDELVYSYETSLIEPASPGNVALSITFDDKIFTYDDALVSLDAPSNFNLYVDSIRISPTITASHGKRNWLWKYQGRQEDTFDGWTMYPAIHISTFKNMNEEQAVMRRSVQ